MSARPRMRSVLTWIAASVAGLVVLEVGARGFLWLRGHPYDSTEVESEASRVLLGNAELTTRTDVDDANGAPWANGVPGVNGTPGANGESGANGPEHPMTRNAAADARDARCLHPYLGWETARGTDELDACLREGERNNADTLDILILGGSVAEAFARETEGRRHLREILLADPSLAGKTLRILGFGREGYKAPQPLNLLIYLLDLGVDPDVVIEIDGAEQVALGIANAAAGTHPVFPATKYWSALASSGTNDRSVLDARLEVRGIQRSIDRWARAIIHGRLAWSALLGEPALGHLLDLRDERMSKMETYADTLANVARRSLHGPTLDGGEPEAIVASALAWRECSRSMQAVCRGRGIAYLHVLHPALHDKGSKDLTPGEVERGRAPGSWTRGVELGYPVLRAKGAELARQGVSFLDASMIFHDTQADMYVDAYRFGPAGNRMLAEAIGSELSKHGPSHGSPPVPK